MKPEAAAYLAKAKEQLMKAPALLAQGFTDDAGRAAYLAGFHAAQALIFERTGRSAKNSQGRSNSIRCSGESRAELRCRTARFLPKAYNLKAVADYETGPDSHLQPGLAETAITIAQRFIDAVSSLIPASGHPPRPPSAKP